MAVEHYIHLPPDLINLLLTMAFALAIGLELRQYHLKNKSGTLYGTDRTHLFIGLAGYVLYLLNRDIPYVFWAGEIFLIASMTVYYYFKIKNKGQFGITTLWTTFITYHLAALLYTQPLWLTFAVVSVILLFMQLKQFFWQLTKTFDEDEFITLSKFLLMSGTLLPLLSHRVISESIPVSPFDIWLAVVVVSGISYLSYWLRKFIFPSQSILLSGILGGLYSSTATTLVLARKSKQDPAHAREYAASILAATGMMFIRVEILALLLHPQLGRRLLLPLLGLAALTLLIALGILKWKNAPRPAVTEHVPAETKNPLELKTAFLFAALFVFFSVLTHYVLQHYGRQGLQILSFVVGFTDIDPFLLGLFTGHYQAPLSELATATMVAVASNNLLKMLYALIWGHRQMRRPLIAGFLTVIVANLAVIFLL